MAKVRLWNNQTNQIDEVDPEQVSQLVGSQSHSLRKGVFIPVVDPSNGQVLNIPSEQAVDAFTTGFQYATPEMLKQTSQQQLSQEIANIKEEELGGIIGQTSSLAQGIARGATLGASDVLQRGFHSLTGDDEYYKEYLNTLKEVNPGMSVAGQVAGSIAAIPLIGAAGAGEAAATTAGSVAAAMAPIGKTIAEKVVRGVTQQAIEGGIMGVGDGISEAALGDPSMVAENIIRGAETGVIWGAALGGGLPLLGAAAKGTAKGLGAVERGIMGKILPKDERAVQAYTDLLQNPAERAAIKEAGGLKAWEAVQKETAGITAQAETAVKDFARGIKVLVEQGDRDVGTVTKQLKTMTKAQKRAVNEVLDAQITQWGSNVKQMIATQIPETPTMTQPYKLMKTTVQKEAQQAGLSADVAKIFDDIEAKLTQQGIVPDANDRTAAMAIWEVRQALSKPSQYMSRNPSEMAQEFRKLREKSDTFLKGFWADEKTKQIFAEQDPIFTQMKRLEKVRSKIDSAEASKFNRAVEALTAVAPMSPVSASIKQYRALQDGVLSNSTAQQKLKNELFNMFNTIDAPEVSKLVTGFENVVEIMGDKGSELFLQTMTRLRNNQGAVEKVAPILSDAALSPIDKAIQIQKALDIPLPSNFIQKIQRHQKSFENLAIVQEASQQHPGYLAKAIASALGWQVAGGIGAVAAPLAMDLATSPMARLNLLTNLERTQNKSAEVVQRAADWLTGKTGKIAGTLAIKEDQPFEPAKLSKQDYLKVYNTYSVFNDPFKAAEIAGEQAKQYSDVPKIQQAYADQILRTGQLIAQALPPPTTINTVTGQRILPPPRDAIRQAMRQIRVLENPNALLESIAKGYIPTRAEVQALSQGYPKTYESLRQRLQDNLIDNPEVKLSSSERVKLATLFQLGQEDHQNPETAQFIRNYVYAPQQQQQQQIKQPNSAKLKMIGGMQTDVDRVSMGEIND